MQRGKLYTDNLQRSKESLLQAVAQVQENCTNDSESDSNSYYNLLSRGSESTGELHTCKNRKLNVSVNDSTYPSPNKDIQQNKIKLNNIKI
jgi:hypothetical protein